MRFVSHGEQLLKDNNQIKLFFGTKGDSVVRCADCHARRIKLHEVKAKQTGVTRMRFGYSDRDGTSYVGGHLSTHGRPFKGVRSSACRRLGKKSRASIKQAVSLQNR